MSSQLVKVTLAAGILSGTSNMLAQFLDAYQSGRPFAFDRLLFLRFVTLTLLTTPPNYKWQQYLERAFPAYAPTKTPLRDVESGRKDKEKDKDEKGYVHEAVVPPQKQKLNIKNTMAKWFIDCITVGALVNTVLFFVLMGVLKGQPTATIAQNVRTETIPLIIAGYKVWPLVSIISFSFVPVERRIIFINIVGLFWGIYMSLVAAKV